MRALLPTLTTLSLALLTACSARTFTTAEAEVEAGSVTRLTVEVRAQVDSSPISPSPTLCAALPVSWPAPTVTYVRPGGVVQTASSAVPDSANAHRDVSGEGLSWRCFQTASLPKAAGNHTAESGQAFVDVSVPADAEGLYPVRTLGLWMASVWTVVEGQQTLRVQRAPTDTFDVWKAPTWGTRVASTQAVTYGDRFVAAGPDGFSWSLDGEAWTAVNDDEQLRLSSVAYGNGVWVGVNNGSVGRLSFEGSTPTWQSAPETTKPVWEVVFAHGLFVARGDEGLLLTSPDGATWTEHETNLPYLWAVAANEAGFIATGPSVLLRSVDGLTWTQTPTEHEWEVRQPVYGNGRWLALASSPDTEGAVAVDSIDEGLTWRPIRSLPSGLSAYEPSLWFVDGRFVVWSIGQALYGSGTSGWAPLLTGYSGRLSGFAQKDDRVVTTGEWAFAATAVRRAPADLRFLSTGWPTGSIDSPYLQPVTVTGGQGAVTLEVGGGALPPGLALEGDVIVGTPTAAGTFAFSLRATDEAGATLMVPFTLEVNNPPRLPKDPILYIPLNTVTEVRLPIQGGTAPFTATASGTTSSVTVDGSELVLSLFLDTLTPSSLSLSVTDQEGLSSARSYLVQALAAPVILDQDLSPIVSGVEWSAFFELVSGTPAQWAVDGALPEGFEARQTAGGLLLTGTYVGDVEGEYPIVIEATDPVGATAERPKTLQVVVPPRLTADELPLAIVGEAYAFELQSTLGQAPITWTIDGAQVPGLAWTETEDGQKLSGIPTEKGLFQQWIRLTDNRGLQTVTERSLLVAERPTLVQPTPARAVVGHTYALSFEVTGGQAPYRFEIDGELPPGLTTIQDAGTFQVTGVPTDAGSFPFTVSVTDDLGLADSFEEVRVQVVTEPRLTARELPDAIVSVPYQELLQIVDGSFPFTCNVQGDLPPGLSLVATGATCLFEGEATEAGEFSFTVTVVDAYELWATQTYELTSKESPPPEVVSPALPLAVVGQPYEATYSVTSGVGPMNWRHSGELPEGLSFTADEDGYSLTGTPTAAGSYAFEVTVTDAYGFEGDSGSQTLEVVTAPSITTETLVDGQVGVAYEAKIEATGGTAPYVWSSTGDLPAGLTFAEKDGDYVLSGTPSTSGAFTFTVKVTDAHSLESTREFTVTIAPVDAEEEEEEPTPTSPENDGGCGGCDATGATSLLALAGLALLRRRRGLTEDHSA